MPTSEVKKPIISVYQEQNRTILAIIYDIKLIRSKANIAKKSEDMSNCFQN
jgi:hypothetical protein